MFSAIERQQMMSAVRETILHGINYGTMIEIEHKQFNDSLLVPGSAFVTLTMDGLLRGCVGSIETTEPLIDSLIYNAFNAAFDDPRFFPVSQDEFSLIDIELAIIGQRTPLACTSIKDLAIQLRPGIDGLIIIAEDSEPATFLPSVWNQLSNTDSFISALLIEAGQDHNTWNPTLRAERFEVTTLHHSHKMGPKK